MSTLDHEVSGSVRWQRNGGRALLIALLALVAALSLARSLTDPPRYDFHHFYLDARYTWEHGVLNPAQFAEDPLDARQLPFYLPAFTLLIAPLAFAGQAGMAVGWAALQVGGLAYATFALRDWAREELHSDDLAEAAVGFTLLLGLPAIHEAVRFNQLSLPLLACILAGYRAWRKQRRATAGTWWAVAVVVKLLPALLLPWILLKRAWRSTGMFILATIIVVVLPCLVTWGWGQTIAAHRQWWTYNVGGAPAKGLVDSNLRAHFIDHRNQSLASVAAHWLAAEHPYRLPIAPVSLPKDAVLWLARIAWLVLAAAMFWWLRKPAVRLGEGRLRGELALLLIAMMVFSPLLRQYYLVWALPGLLLLTLWALADLHAPRLRILGRIGLVTWLVGMLAWLWPEARLAGAHLLMLIVIGGLLMTGGSRCQAADDAGNTRRAASSTAA